MLSTGQSAYIAVGVVVSCVVKANDKYVFSVSRIRTSISEVLNISLERPLLSREIITPCIYVTELIKLPKLNIRFRKRRFYIVRFISLSYPQSCSHPRRHPQISYVGAEHVDSSSVSDAVAGHTLFIHGSRVDDGNIASRRAASEQAAKRRTNKFSTTSSRMRSRQRKRKQRRLRSPEEEEDEGGFPDRACTSACGSLEGGDDASGLPEGTSTVCDDSCAGSRARFDGFLCGAGNADKYGAMCRLCFTDIEEARGVQRVLAENSNGAIDERVIMCDTMKPPEDIGCSTECHSKSYTVR